MKYIIAGLLVLVTYSIHAKFEKTQLAFENLTKDTAYQKAIISFALIENKKGKLIFEHQSQKLLAPASTLKTYTTASALHYLGEDFRYCTKITFQGKISNKSAEGVLKIYGSGDPSFGSERFNETKPEVVKKAIYDALRKAGIESFKGEIDIIENVFADTTSNTGWLAEDIGNYYGAGLYGLNWKENKFELNLAPTATGFEVTSTNAGFDVKKDFCLELIHKEGATTEEAFAFVELQNPCMYTIRGVLSKAIKAHNMQLARLNPAQDFKKELISYLQKEMNFTIRKVENRDAKEIEILKFFSPPLKQLVFWCNQKSLNLYAESLCKTISVHHKIKDKSPFLFPRTIADTFIQGSWLAGIYLMKQYASELKLKSSTIALLDGSGLAPQNRISTFTLASLLQKFVHERFYATFYESLPSINGIRMKSGYIGGTRSYAGYIKLSDSSEASFAFIVNNYSCSPKRVKQQMFQVLDVLKTEMQ